MVLPGHIAGGYLVSRLILSWAPASFSSVQIVWLTVVGTLAGELPDIDIAYFSFKKIIVRSETVENHRDYLTHAPVIWLIVAGLISIAGELITSQFIVWLGIVVFAGTWTHFILDSIEYGVRWLWPFSNRRFALRKAPPFESSRPVGSLAYYWDYISSSYVYYLTFYLEIVVVLTATYLLLAHI
ncbi:MAG: metal-dependent hydrolase [Patescibacteria group bacterium]|nr:metal-dependent hydrolase [Patescibacteria group bacterium]MDE2172562.1 metal-dependent hydrolase [Patescibacteria group bacterium]